MSNMPSSCEWNQLVWQEIWMWCKVAKYINEQEFVKICSIRKFNEQQVAFLKKALET